jgi:diguanylate cyclase
MLQHGVAPTPSNFAVWYGYTRGDPPELKRAIDILIAKKKPFDSVTRQELFLKYLVLHFAGGTASEVPDQLKSIMTAAKGFLTEAISDNRTQIRAIGDVAEKAERGIDPRSLVECLMAELAKAALRASELEVNLNETSRELDIIRKSLSQAEQRANTDTLTGLPNRRAFDEFLRTSQMSAMESGEALSLLMVDIDHFKHVNDNFGHGVGDQVLRLIASVLRERLREKDMPARYGGEELIAALPGAGLTVCEAVAERIRQAVSDCRIIRRKTGEPLPPITISIGVAQFRPGESASQLLERCDRALYFAKRSGRNRVISEDVLGGRSIA